MGNRVIHISASEAARDFAALLDHVRAGDEVVIEHDARPVAVLRPAAPAQSLGEAFAAIAQEVPDEDWKRVPSDLAKNLDHYLYGTSKVSS
jgi:prevent-host-death family protein